MFFFFKQKTAYEVRISDWSSDVCSSDLRGRDKGGEGAVPESANRAALTRQLLSAAKGWQVKGAEQVERDRDGEDEEQQYARRMLQLERPPDLLARRAQAEEKPSERQADDRKSTRLNSSHSCASRMTSSA